MMTFNKKGNAFVEAALIYPLTVLSIVAVIYAIIFLFNTVNQDSKLFLAINCAAGEYSETYNISPKVTGNNNISKGVSKVKGSNTIYGQELGVFKAGYKRKREALGYVLNEKRHIRVSDCVIEK